MLLLCDGVDIIWRCDLQYSASTSAGCLDRSVGVETNAWCALRIRVILPRLNLNNSSRRDCMYNPAIAAGNCDPLVFNCTRCCQLLESHSLPRLVGSVSDSTIRLGNTQNIRLCHFETQTHGKDTGNSSLFTTTFAI
jgi:hypothetical protein